MRNCHFIIGFCLLMSACSRPPVYYGNKLPPTNSVDIYYSAIEVRRHYKTIGYFTIRNYPESTIKKSLSKYAKSVGADAVIILGFEPVQRGKPRLLKAKALKYLSRFPDHVI